MELNGIFLNPVSRPIEGVIKADDEASLYDELSEYVLTDEVAKRLEHFSTPTLTTMVPTGCGYPASSARVSRTC